MKSFAIKINEPWWGAWKKFNWPDRTWGVGLKKTEVDNAISNGCMLKVSIRKFKKTYKVDPIKVRDFSQKNKTEFVAKFDTVLYVIPEYILLNVASK